MRKDSLALAAVGPLFLGVNGPAGSAAPDRKADFATNQMVREIDERLVVAARNGFGGAVIIQRGGRTLLAKGYGFADRERRLPFTPSTIAQIGSITKSQTAAAIAVLIANGKVSLNAPVSRYIPEAPEPARSRTIGQLLSHSSGLADTCADDFDRVSERSFISRCLAIPLAFKAGEDHYSNMGYSALALVAQRASKKNWEQLVASTVWRPLGLRDIGFTFAKRSDTAFAKGYLKGVKQPVISRSIAALGGNDWALRGNGGVQASADTMIRFLDELLSPHSRLGIKPQALLVAPVDRQTGEVREGFGMVFRYAPDGRIVRMGHSGSDGIFYSYIGWIPSNDARIYFVGNNGEEDIKPVLKDVLKATIGLPASSVVRN